MYKSPIIHQKEDLSGNSGWKKFRIGLLLAGALLLFLFAINLMVASLHKLGDGLTETILLATANPFNGLFIGLLITALLQSSSTSSSLVVAFVASGAISVEAAIPIIMGANIGTTITSTIVSLGFINKKKEFKRAVTAGTYHDFFNILTVLILFPLEYYYRVLSNFSSRVADLVFVPVLKPVSNVSSSSPWGFSPVVEFLSGLIQNGLVLTIISMAILFGSILLFRRMVSNILQVKQPQLFSRFFFKNPLKSFGWGMAITAAIRSSTITTSVVVPVVAKKIVTIRQAAPFILGANIGTTITAFIAVTVNPTTREAIIIASAHFLFNFIGVMLFFPFAWLREIPVKLANQLGRLTLKYRLTGLVYLLSMFFFIPFVLIYFHQDAVRNYTLTYERSGGENQAASFRIKFRLNTRTMQGEWSFFEGAGGNSVELPTLIQPVSSKNETLFIGKQMFLFNRPGFCWDSENNGIVLNTCVAEIIPRLTIGNHDFDSVYVFIQTPKGSGDSLSHRYYYSGEHKIFLLHEKEWADQKTVIEKLVSFEVN